MCFYIVSKEFTFVQCHVIFGSKGLQFDSKICFQRLQNQPKIRSKIGLESEFVSKSLSKSILEGFQVDFGPVWDPKWPAFCPENRPWERSRAQTRLQRPSGPHLGPFWKHFGNIFKENSEHFGLNFV